MYRLTGGGFPISTIAKNGLIVDSSFRSRKELITDLSSIGLVENILEARSVTDGIKHLKALDMDACIVGPSLTTNNALGFIKNARDLESSQRCAFIKVLSKDQEASVFTESGAHGALTPNYNSESFTTIVNQAITAARKEFREGGRGKKQLPPSVADSLQESARALEKVANLIARGRLAMQDDGTPSLAAQDAIRVAVEKAFPEGSLASEVGSFDNYFVSSIVAWFVDRVYSPQSVASEKLRRRLLSYHELMA